MLLAILHAIIATILIFSSGSSISISYKVMKISTLCYFVKNNFTKPAQKASIKQNYKPSPSRRVEKEKS